MGNSKGRSFLVPSEKQDLWMKFLNKKKDVPDYLSICSLSDKNNVVTFHAMQLLFNYSRKIYAYHLLFAWHIIEEYIKETK